MPRQGQQRIRVRLKLVAIGPEKILFVRFQVFTEHARSIGYRLRELVPSHGCTFDGEIYKIRGDAGIRDAVRLLRDACEPVYDPNLLRSEMGALPNPWPIPDEPLKTGDKPIVYMALVRHPEMAESVAFQLPRYDDDFMIEFRRRIPKSWRRYRNDLKIWTVADHYQPHVHDVLDSFYDCRWDEMLAGDEWDILPPPKNTQYPVRGLIDADFAVLGVKPGCEVWELQVAYREKKEAYKSNNLHPDEWYDVDTAFQRIVRHHRPRDPDQDLPEQVAAPRRIILLLRQIFATEHERVLWFHRHQASLGGSPQEIASTADGEEHVVRALELMLLLRPKPS